jgi:sigma-B regulation protein RsbU (phosphoserine phosphatase)
VLCKDARHNKFVTLALLVLNVKTRAVRWASAGHDPAVILNPKTGEFFELEGGGLPLGIFDDATYDEFSHPGLPEHAILTLGSDGIWEAGDPAKELFGKDRWKDVIKMHQHASASEIGQQIATAVRDFRRGEPQQDDVTFIVAKLL